MNISNFKLERFFSVHEFTAKHLLCGSDCESLRVNDVLSFDPSYPQKLLDLGLGYTESKGHPMLREEIAKLYEDIVPDDVLVFSGAEEGIFVFMNTMLGKGDHALVQFPAYQSLYEVARSVGARITNIGMKEEEGWSLDIDLLEQSVQKSTKAIILNSPHNPTGHVIPKETQKRILDLAEDKDICVFADEVYRFLRSDGHRCTASFCDPYDKAFSLGVMSKSFGLAGLRIGWIASRDKGTMRKMAAFKDYTSICSSAPSELLSIMALQNKDAILSRNQAIVDGNIAQFDAFAKRHEEALSWVRPAGGSTGFPRLHNGVSSHRLVEDVLQKKGVLLLPSECFDYGDSHFRVGLGRRTFSEGLTVLEEYMDNDYAALG